MSGQICLEDNDYSTDAENYDIYCETDKFETSELPKKSDITFVTLTDVIDVIQERCREISELLDVHKDEALIILNHYKWRQDLLESDWFENEEQRRKQVGIEPQEAVVIENTPETLCCMCFDSKPREEFDSLKCNHLICKDCWTDYIQYNATRPENGFFWKCPMQDCNMVISDTFNRKYIHTENMSQYQKKMARAYTDSNKSLRWCPAVNCQYGVEAVNLCAQPIDCRCGWTYCFKCGLEDHRPCPCDIAEEWIKNGGNNEVILYQKWLLAFTKDCPKCKKPIEKNQGCNHMTCRNLGCMYEFCWLCLEKWNPQKDHYYCTTYETLSQSQKDAFNEQKAKERQELSRFCNYASKFKSYEDSLKAINSISKLIELEKDSFDEMGLAEHQMDFLQSACKTLKSTKRLLKWSYAYTFGVAEQAQRNICEILQKKMHRQTAHLQKLLEWKYQEAKYSKYYAECKENIRSAEFKCKQLAETFLGKVDEHENKTIEETAKNIWNEKLEEAKKVKAEQIEKATNIKKKKRLGLNIGIIVAMILLFASFWLYNPVFFA